MTPKRGRRTSAPKGPARGNSVEDEFAARYPNLSNFVKKIGIVEVGYWPGHQSSLVRVLLEENLPWESDDRFATMDELFEALEDAVTRELQ